VRSYNFAPSLAYEINNWISIGLGVQFQYATGGFVTGLPVNAAGVGGLSALTNTGNLQFNGWGYGFTAGVTLTPTPNTTIGIGYRSGINQKVDGSFSLPAGGVFTPGFGSTPGAVEMTLRLPDIVSVGLRHRVSPQWTVLAGFEWSNWSRIGTSAVNQTTGAPATLIGTPVTIPLNYKDGYYYSLGAEYEWSPALTLRSGIAFEKSPVTDDVRTPRLPDNDRFWLSAGLSYKVNRKITLDAAYSHLFVKSTSVSNALAGTPIVYNGTVDAHVDIISVGLKYRWDDPVEPVRQRYVK
jgi:long-chain fatty acid transport protein